MIINKKDKMNTLILISAIISYSLFELIWNGNGKPCFVFSFTIIGHNLLVMLYRKWSSAKSNNKRSFTLDGEEFLKLRKIIDEYKNSNRK